MILPDHHIRALKGNDQPKVFDPWSERALHNGMSYGLSCAGYDVRIKGDYVIPAGGFALASTVERFSIPSSVIAIVHDKSTWARRGVAVQNTVAEPGWNGWLTLEITNHSKYAVEILDGDPIAQILFHKLCAEPERAYSGKYQSQPDRPVGALLEQF